MMTRKMTFSHETIIQKIIKHEKTNMKNQLTIFKYETK